MTRKQQSAVMILASALTAACQYILQGAMATGGNPLQWDEMFWTADRILWGIRALIESWVIVYLFTTQARNWMQEILLLVLEILLLVLITFTLGPVFQALGAGTTVYDLLSKENYNLWAFAIGAYTGLMMAGAGLAYKIQPYDLDEETEKTKFWTKWRKSQVDANGEGSIYSQWGKRNRPARLDAIVQYVRDNDPAGTDGVLWTEVEEAVWKDREGSASTKDGDRAHLIEKGRLKYVDENGGRDARVVASISL